MEKVPLVVRAFEVADGGLALRKIIPAVGGLATRAGQPLFSSSLYALLTNPFYCTLAQSGEHFQKLDWEAGVAC